MLTTVTRKLQYDFNDAAGQTITPPATMFPRGDHGHCMRSDRPRSYERASIVEWLQKHDTSPAPGFPPHLRGRLLSTCTPPHALLFAPLTIFPASLTPPFQAGNSKANVWCPITRFGERCLLHQFQKSKLILRFENSN